MATAMRTGFAALALSAALSLAAASASFAWHAFFAALEEPFSLPDRTSAPSFRLPDLYRHDEVALHASALVGMPLFSPQRQPPLPPVIAAPPAPPPARSTPPPPPPDYVVGGIVVAASARKILLRFRGRSKGTWFKEGDVTAEGWSVSSIRLGDIVLMQGNRTIHLTFGKGAGRVEHFVALQ
jgi:hypothetical protein